MWKRAGLAVLTAAVVVGSAGAIAGGVRHRDAVGDVEGAAGPDITAVTVSERAHRIRFRIEFAKSPPLRFAKDLRFTDVVIIAISTTGRADPQRASYFLGVHAVDLKHVVLSRWPKRGVVASGPAVVSGNSLTLSVDPRRIGDPESIRFSVAAGREFAEGQGGGEDHAPNSGTWLWIR